MCFVAINEVSLFCRYMINTPKEKRSLFTELTLALFSSLFAGFGAIFMINLTGNYL